MSKIVGKPWFAFINLLLVLVSGIVWISIPKLGMWFTLLALLPWLFRWLVAKFPFQRTPFDWLLMIFLLTGWVGYWAAYDQTSAWIKAWLIVTAVLLYYSLSSQPKENFNALSLLSFCIGLGVAFYFFLTHDFTNIPGSIAPWWMNHRPVFGWHAIHHGYISGLLVITNIFAVYWLWTVIKKPLNRYTVALKLLLIPALGIIFLASILTMSRGIWAAVACSLGVWLLWKFFSNSYAAAKGIKSLFPAFVFVYMGAIILFVYLGPARSNDDSGQNDYGRNSRAEVFERGAYFLQDYPFTGAGLNSFPGLYSEYTLSIPYFYFINSYNMFLDAAIEQGLLGGFALIFIYAGSVWLVTNSILKTQSNQIRCINWLSLFVLIVTIIHGLFYDYLYFSNITMLLFFPVGVSVMGIKELSNHRVQSNFAHKILPSFSKISIRSLIATPAVLLLFILVFNSNKIISMWYANLGAVEMAKVDLVNYPSSTWYEGQDFSRWNASETYFQRALAFESDNETANYRLGLIKLVSRDYESAASYLLNAYEKDNRNRGVIKNLGYSYVWLGDMKKAQVLLEKIPEAHYELSIYSWWWDTQHRGDLGNNASMMCSLLESSSAIH